MREFLIELPAPSEEEQIQMGRERDGTLGGFRGRLDFISPFLGLQPLKRVRRRPQDYPLVLYVTTPLYLTLTPVTYTLP
ncbi:hypothetical protein SRHO_G00331220 [Serrasalmus rhombeus]